MQRATCGTIALVLCAGLGLALPRPSNAANGQAQIDYSMLLTDSDAPPGADAKLKQAAQLAAKSPRCARVVGGFYVPPSDQLPQNRGEPYMINCSAAGSQGAYNVYFSDAELSGGAAKGPPVPVGRRAAIDQCRTTLKQRYEVVSINPLGVGYDAKASGNVAVIMALTVQNGFGAKFKRWGHCIITPDGKMSAKDVWLSKR